MNFEENLKNLIESAKVMFGEFKDELIGYEKGYDGYNEIIWSEKLLQLNELQDDEDYGMPTDEDIKQMLESDHHLYWYDNHDFVIAKRYKIINRGWKLQLTDIIKNYKH